MSDNRKEISEAEFEAIERYLLGKMDDAARTAFEARLSQDDTLREEVALQRRLMAAIEIETFFRAAPPAGGAGGSATIIKLRNYWKYAAAILIGVASLLGLWYYFAGPDAKQDLYAAYFRPDYGLPVVMSTDPERYVFYEGMVSYKEGQYEDAIQVWQELATGNNMTDTLQYYIGSAYLNMGNLPAAERLLTSVSGNDRSAFREKAIWYSALLKLKQDDRDAARTLLRQLPANREAVELLSKIP